MSKRFGRNQRRAARERLSALETAQELSNALLRTQAGKIHSLETEIKDAKRIAGPLSSMFLPSAVALDGGARGQVYVPAHQPVRPYVGLEEGFLPMKSVPLTVMLSDIKIDDISDRLHARVTFGDKRVGYAISRKALEEVPADVLIQRIAKEMAAMLGPQMYGASFR